MTKSNSSNSNDVDLKSLSKKIEKEGKENGLTDTQLGKRKNKHWNDVYRSLVWGFRIFLICLGIWMVTLLICYSVNVVNDPEYLKKLVENFFFGALIILATFGAEQILAKFFKQGP